MKRRLVLVSLSVALGDLMLAARETRLPRYQFEVGQELYYEVQNDFVTPQGKGRRLDQWNVWVVNRNTDGSWRLVLRNGLGKPGKRGDPLKAGGEEHVSFGFLDLHPDGRIRSASKLAEIGIEFHYLLPRLPNKPSELERGWERIVDRRGLRYQYAEVRESENGLWTLRLVSDGLEQRLIDETNRALISFNRERGFVERVETSVKSNSYTSETELRIQMKRLTRHDVTWARRLAEEMTAYFSAQDSVLLPMRTSLGLSEGSTRQLCGDVKSRLSEVGKTVRLPLAREAFNHLERQLTEIEGVLLSAAKDAGPIVGRRAPSWEATDLKGNRHTHRDHSGKVLVLDFWQKTCPPCIRSMPQIEAVAEQFKNRPVSVLSMNADRREEDARFVKEKLKLAFPVLLASSVAKSFQVKGYPTIVVIDRTGIIRHYHLGYSSNLRGELVDVIERVLRQDEG